MSKEKLLFNVEYYFPLKYLVTGCSLFTNTHFLLEFHGFYKTYLGLDNEIQSSKAI